MMRIPNLSIAVAILALVAMRPAEVSAQTIVSYGFTSLASDSPDILTPTGAGVIGSGPGDQWMIETAPEVMPANPTALTDINGDPTLYSFTHTGFFPHNTENNFGVNAPDGIPPFQNSWFGRNGDADQSYTFSGFNPGDVLDLVLFANYHFPEGGAGAFTRGTDFIIGATQLGTTGQNSTPTEFLEGENYVMFDGVVADVFGNVEVAVEPGVNSPGAGFPDVNGFQFSVVPGQLTVDASIDRDTGSLTIDGLGDGLASVLGYAVGSNIGGLDPDNWNSVANTGDVDSGGSIDANDAWTIISAAGANDDLSEFVLVSPGPSDGFSLPGGNSLNLGNVWVQNPVEDIVLDLALPGGVLKSVPVRFTGNNDASFEEGDLDFDGDLDAQDWVVYLAGAKVDLSGLSPAQAYQMGDLTGDNVNNIVDLNRFIKLFEGQNGSGSFALMIAGVPEPSSGCILLIGMIGLGLSRNRRKARRVSVSAAPPAHSATSRCATRGLVLSLLCVLGFTGLSRGADFFTEDFTDGLPGPNMALGTGFGTPTFDFTDDFTITSGINNRIYLGTNAADYSSVNFTFEAEFTFANRTNWSIAFFGMGTPDAAGAGAFGEPVNGPNAIATLWPLGPDATPDLGRVRSKDNFIGTSSGHVDEDTLEDLLIGTHKMRLTWDAIAASALFEVDVDNDGFVESSFTIDGSDNDFSVTNSHLFVGGGDGLSVDNISVTAGSPFLSLQVDTVTGAARIVNPSASPFAINGYDIDSPGGALDPIGWNSLADQNLDPVDGPDPDTIVGNGDGETWLEGGSADPNEKGLLEGFFLGSTTIAPSGSVSIGNAFDTSVFGSGIDGDLSFLFNTVDGTVLTGQVEYVMGAELTGDYNNNGVVDAADYTVWRDTLGSTDDLRADGNDNNEIDEGDYTVWKSNFGNVAGTGSASASLAVPEPSSLAAWLIGCCALMASRRCRISLPRFSKLGPFVMAVAWAAVGSTALATVYNDRVYRLGDGVGLGNENGAAGIVVGTGIDNPVPGSTLDSGVPGDPPSGSFIDMQQLGSPLYVDVSTVGSGRPGSASGELGVQFDGTDDVLFGDAMNVPEEMVDRLGGYFLNYTGLTARGLQMWVYPDQAGLDAGVRQGIVMDTVAMGGVSITADGKWTQTNDAHVNDTDIEATTAVVGDQWYHVMHHVYPTSLPGAPRVVPGTGSGNTGFTGVVYVDGLAVSANNDRVTIGDFDAGGRFGLLAVGSEEVAEIEPGVPGYDNHFAGVIDELTMYVFEDNTDQGGQNYGPFDLFADNEWIAQEITDTVPGGILDPGDVNRDGAVNSGDVTAFIAGWRREKRLAGAHNTISVGDWETWGWGDMNHDGRVFLDDAFILHDALKSAGAGGLNFSLLNGAPVPEPTGLTLLAIGMAPIVWRRRHRR